jgi:hypothetical protein
MLHRRSAHSVVGTSDAIYALGGSGVGGPVLEVERFDGKQWVDETRLPGDGLNAPASVVLNGRIYVMGGFEGLGNRPTDKVLVYDLATHVWSEAPPLPAPRGGHAAVVLNGRIHVLGGGNSESTIPDHSMFDPETNRWTELAPLRRAKGSVAAVVFGGKIFAIGGRSGSFDFGDVDIYDATRNKWSRGPRIGARGTAGAAVYRGAVSRLRRRVPGAGEDTERRDAAYLRQGHLAARQQAANGTELRACSRAERCGLRRRREPGRG